VQPPVLVWFCFGVFWLLVGSLLAFCFVQDCTVRIDVPDLRWLTFGRVRSPHLGSVARLGLRCRLPSRSGRCAGYRARVDLSEDDSRACLELRDVLGVGGILAGYGTSVEWLDMPPIVGPFFVTSLGLVAAWTVATFRNRRERHVYVTQWYILGAMFWMPWLYLTAVLLIFGVDFSILGARIKMEPATGVVQATTNWWFNHNAGLVTPIGVGTAYYLIPKSSAGRSTAII
jgi:cytochrome c oxidase cbb3-type subunit 1